MSVVEEDISALSTLGFLTEGETVTETSGSPFGHSWLAIERPARHAPLALANAIPGYKVRKDIAQAWPGPVPDYSIGEPQVAVAPLIGDL